MRITGLTVRCSRIVFIEGISGAGKTKTFNEAGRRYMRCRNIEGFVALSQQYTHRLLPDPLHATEQDVLWIWKELSTFIILLNEGFLHSQFSGHARRSEIEPRFLLEGSIAGALVEYDLPISPEIRAIASGLERLGAIVILLTIPEGQVSTRSVSQTLAVRGERWRKYVERLGSDQNEAGMVLRMRQSALRETLVELGMSFVELSTEAQAWDRYANVVLEHLGAKAP